MEYGVLLNGQLLIHKKQEAGDKPIERTAAPSTDYDEALYFWFEVEGEAIVQHWGKHKIPDAPMPEPTAEDKAEAYDILTGVSE